MNKIIISGRLTRDPEIKNLEENKKIANIAVAVRRNYKNSNGEYDSDFFNATAFGSQAEFLEKYFKKGQEIILSGRLQSNSWQTESGETRYSTSIVIEEVNFCGSKKEEINDMLPKDVNFEVTDKDDSLPF